jgi:hypothetical protein
MKIWHCCDELGEGSSAEEVAVAGGWEEKLSEEPVIKVNIGGEASVVEGWRCIRARLDTVGVAVLLDFPDFRDLDNVGTGGTVNVEIFGETGAGTGVIVNVEVTLERDVGAEGHMKVHGGMHAA